VRHEASGVRRQKRKKIKDNCIKTKVEEVEEVEEV
jgi:hypothetical protein